MEQLARGRHFLAAFILFILIAHPLFGVDKQAEGMALIQRAVDLTDLRGSGPYRMRSSLTVYDQALGTRTGIDVDNFISPQRWRRDLQMTGYNEIAVFLGNYMYRSRTSPFTPPSLRGDLAGSLRNLPELLKYKVLRLYTRNINDVTAQCVYLQQDKKEYPAEVRWCFDPSSGLPLETFSGNEYWHTKFAGYKPFGTKFVPGTIELFFRSESRGKAVIESIEPQVNDPEHIFKPPSDAVGRPWCDDMQGVRPSVFQPVSVPPGARSRQGLELVYELTIDEKGRVLTVIPMAEKPFVDRIAIKSMLDWEFEPAKCGDTPVMSDIYVDIIHFMRQ